MEAPVPASALIHSATLVSAGLYLLMRLQPIVELYIDPQCFAIIGAITAAYGGSVAAAQTDLKRALAYSTISHCGFLFVTLALHNFTLTILYLYIHGIFKALTFFCVGTFIKLANSQDVRQMGQLHRILPLPTIFLIFSATSLGGFPFTFGFIYKKLFLITLLSQAHSIFIIGLCFIGFLTSLIYVYRIVYYTCFDQLNNKFFILKTDVQSINPKPDTK